MEFSCLFSSVNWVSLHLQLVQSCTKARHSTCILTDIQQFFSRLLISTSSLISTIFVSSSKPHCHVSFKQYTCFLCQKSPRSVDQTLIIRQELDGGKKTSSPRPYGKIQNSSVAAERGCAGLGRGCQLKDDNGAPTRVMRMLLSQNG